MVYCIQLGKLQQRSNWTPAVPSTSPRAGSSWLAPFLAGLLVSPTLVAGYVWLRRYGYVGVSALMARRRHTQAGSGRIECVCSFCGKGQTQVRRLIAGPGGVYICNECVDLCREIIDEEKGATS